MQIIKKAVALLCICVMVATMFSYKVMAAESTSYGNTSSDLSDYGFVVDKTVYNKACTAALQSRNILLNGKPIFTQNTRVYICREKNTYNDVILTFTELVPNAYTLDGKEYRSYPESLTVSCKFVNNSAGAQYKTSSPKTQTVSSSYSIGGSASIGSSNVGISGNVTLNEQKNVLVIKNLSNSDTNKFEVVYDFQPGWNGKHSFFTNYLHNTTEHLGTVSVKANSKNYGFCMKFSTNVACTQGWFVLNSANDCVRITHERAIITNFK